MPALSRYAFLTGLYLGGISIAILFGGKPHLWSALGNMLAGAAIGIMIFGR